LPGSRFASNLLFQFCRRAEARLIQDCTDHIEVVSHNMAEYVRRAYPRFTGPITVVPSGINAPINDAAYERSRHLWRQRLGLDPSQPAAAYSGSISKWQRVPDVVALARVTPNLQTFLFLVGDPSKFPTDLPPNVRIASLSRSEINEALCA